MPLLPNVLEAELMKLDADDGPNPKNKQEVAQAWFNAWWAYAQNMTYLVPGGGGRALVESSFKGILMGGLEPIPVPLPFFLALGSAMLASWASLGIPGILTPPLLSLIPQAAPFGPIGVAIVPVGLASSDKKVPRAMLAGLIHTWTITGQAVGPTGPIGPLS
jgi:hypothetical protein